MRMRGLNVIKGVGGVVEIGEGWRVEIDGEMEKVVDEGSEGRWGSRWFVGGLWDKGGLKDVYCVMNKWGGNEGGMS